MDGLTVCQRRGYPAILLVRFNKRSKTFFGCSSAKDFLPFRLFFVLVPAL